MSIPATESNITEALTGVMARPIMVLLVDDQPFVAALLQRELVSENDISLHYCQDPAAALSTAEKIGPSVILLDLIMPEIDGLTVCQQIRANSSVCDIPIVMLSSNDEPIAKAKAFAAGANDYIVKLPDKVELIARLRYHSASYINKLQRDDACRALRASQMQLVELNMQLLKLANIDGLTGIVNRRHFDERYSEEWLRAFRNRHPLTLIMFDIDMFRQYNDKFGHIEGDECLKRVAGAAQQIVSRPVDTVARFGEDKFILLLPETDAAGAETVAEKLRSKIESLQLPNPDSTVNSYLTVSIGVSTIVPAVNSNPDACLARVDEALYQAIGAGGNRISIVPAS